MVSKRFDKTFFSLDDLNRTLGNPSSQKIFQLLACWDVLPSKAIIEKTGLSESQVHATLRHLEQIEVIFRETKGIYRISPNEFAQTLKKAYYNVLIKIVGQELHELYDHLEELSFEEISRRFTELVQNWKPITEQYYGAKLSSLGQYIIDVAR